MSRANEPWHFRRCIVAACLRKTNDGLGVRRPDPTETPLSHDEIFFGACRGIIRVPALAAHPAPARATDGARL